ncbi:MAG: 2-amino-4-deoxychorismate dehydrogenase [Syntrophorhabdus sp. PtaU1.Bin058]|nr:MAG: 2-amino-4-deoxychorismate dehydrogenase [Syntrophorhabdus sp. PtaU1.Bin058]
MMRETGKARQILLYAAPFVPLAFFKIWAALGQTPAAMTTMAWVILAYFVGLIIVSFRIDKPGYFDWAIGAYFAAIALSLLLWPERAASVIMKYPVTGIYACLFAAAFLPPLAGFPPFTYHYAKKYAPRTVWQNPVFVRINMIMTYVWSALFALALVLSLYPSILTRAVIPLALLLCFGLPFNLRFPDYYLKKAGLPSLAEQKRMAMEGPRRDVSAPGPEAAFSSARAAIAGMAVAFNGKAAGDLKTVIGFHVTGNESFDAYLHIHDGICSFSEERPGTPDLLISTPADTWLAVSSGRLSGQEAFIRQAYTAEGDLNILMRMGQLFGAAQSGEDPGPAHPDRPASSRATAAAPADRLPVVQQKSRKETTMKVLILNSSPRTGGQSKTELMLNALADGMRDSGAEVEIIHLRTKNIKNCIGCFTCWTKTPGVCVIRDDMTGELFPKWAGADLVVYATPLYHFGINAAMKTFVERTLPALQPFFETKGGATSHPWRVRPPKAVVLSVAGFPEHSVFDLLSQWVRFIYSGILVAEIYRPAAEFLTVSAFREKAAEILDATRRAGREIVTTGKVSPDTMAAITQPISTDIDIAFKVGNAMWKTCISEGITPKEMDEKGIIPRPDSIETFMAIMSMGFNQEGAGDTRATIQFNFSGDVEGSCYFRIADRAIETFPGSAEKADLTIDTPFNVWMDIMAGKADGQQMFMEGKYRVTGELALLTRMNRLFGKDKGGR